MTTNEIGDWYRGIPQITRYWFTASVVLPLMGKIGLVSPMTMILDSHLLLSKFQIWRPLTALIYYPIMPQTGFHYLINLYFLYSYSSRLETGLFDGRPADYLFMLIINWICLVFIGLAASLMLLMDPMILSVIYVWCQINKDQIVSFWFGTQFKAMYLPWVLAGFNMILGGGMSELFGILVGHLYFFIMYKYPQEYGGRSLLSTPGFLYSFFPNRRNTAGFGQAPSRRTEEDRGGHRWGRGNTLGGN
ncbi:DgyrCDS7233 [Dimorphilus gyrociliatus]|uniref:Derlin n=1 Tax=Dimorphilus gyrociliatus TaxID=2664684 RepID=A0A7I8VQN1_9ANNE|nr:DgyrCDS7233 [Dimorphilus gyrociliatus]